MFLGFQPFSINKGLGWWTSNLWNWTKNLKAHFFFLAFIDDAAIIKERKACFSRIVDFPFLNLRQFLVFIITIANLPEVSVLHKNTIVDFHNNRNENTTSQVSDNIEFNRSVSAQFCDYELSCRPMYGNQSGFFCEKEETKIPLACFWRVLQLAWAKTDLECDERENDHWQRAILHVKKKMRLITKKIQYYHLSGYLCRNCTWFNRYNERGKESSGF